MTFQNKGRKRNDCVKEKKPSRPSHLLLSVIASTRKKIPFQFLRQNCFQIRRNQRRINSFNAASAIPGFARSFALIHILGVINDESSVLRITIVLYDVVMSSGDKCLCGNMQRITKYKDMTVYAIIRVIKYLRKETAVEKIDTIQITPTAM